MRFPFPRRFPILRYSLRTLLAVTFIVAILLGWQTAKIRQHVRAIALLERLGATVTYDYQSSKTGWVPAATAPGLPWLKQLLGEHYASNVVEVQLFSRDQKPVEFTDDHAEQISVLTRIEWLTLMDTRLTDTGLEHLQSITGLRRLDLEGSQVSDAGVEAFSQARPEVQVYH